MDSNKVLKMFERKSHLWPDLVDVGSSYKILGGAEDSDFDCGKFHIENKNNLQTPKYFPPPAHWPHFGIMITAGVGVGPIRVVDEHPPIRPLTIQSTVGCGDRDVVVVLVE